MRPDYQESRRSKPLRRAIEVFRLERQVRSPGSSPSRPLHVLWPEAFYPQQMATVPALFASGQDPDTGANSFGFGYTTGANFSAVYNFSTVATQTTTASTPHLFGSVLTGSTVTTYVDRTASSPASIFDLGVFKGLSLQRPMIRPGRLKAILPSWAQLPAQARHRSFFKR
jgi:hypothetical protein